MKRKTLKFMACAAVMALTLSVTACGGSDDGAKTNDTTEVADTVGTEDVSEPEDEVETETEDAADAETEEEADSEDEADAEAEEEESTEDAAEVEYATLEEYTTNDPDAKAAVESLAEQLQQEGVTSTVEVKDNEIIMSVKYDASVELPDNIGELLDQVMEAFTDVFKFSAEQFDLAIGQEGVCTVTVRYLDSDDNVLSENSFKAD